MNSIVKIAISSLILLSASVFAQGKPNIDNGVENLVMQEKGGVIELRTQDDATKCDTVTDPDAQNPGDMCFFIGKNTARIHAKMTGPTSCVFLGILVDREVALFKMKENTMFEGLYALDSEISANGRVVRSVPGTVLPEGEEMHYYLAYTCGNGLQVWHPVLKNRPWD